jgi:HK97 family phage major capsid protein
MANVPILITTGIENDQVILSDFSRLIIGIRTQLSIEVLRELYATTLSYGFIAYLRAHVGVLQPLAFAKVRN